MPYEWIALKGQGDMSSSKGNLVSIVNLTQTIPPEVVRYMIFRVKPMRSITFDPGLPLLNLVDEYDDVSAHNHDQRAAELARLEGLPPLGISFKHLVNLVQITEGDVDKLCAILQRHHLPVPERQVLHGRIAYAEYWLQHFSPAEMRLRLHKALPEQVQPAMDGDTVHTLVYALAEEVVLPARALFEAIYIALLDQPRGPRVGWFLSSLDYDFVRTRFQDAAALGR